MTKTIISCSPRNNLLTLKNALPVPCIINIIYMCISFYSTCAHCCNTSSLNLRNPSCTLGSFRGKDRKCVKGCFFLKLSTRTSTRVTADETAALWEPVITVRQRRKVDRKYFVSNSTLWPVLCSWPSPIGPSTPCLGMLIDVFVSNSRRLRVSPFFPMMYL